MKVSFFHLNGKSNYYKGLNTKNNIKSKRNNSQLLKSNATDVVSFSSKSYNEMRLEKIKSSFNEKLAPVIEEDKPLYIEFGKIVNDVQTNRDLLNDAVSQFYSHQLNLRFNRESNPYLKDKMDYIQTAQKFDENRKVVLNILELSNKPMYSASEELKQKIADVKEVFQNSNEVKKTTLLNDHLKKVDEYYTQKLSEYTVTKLDPQIQAKTVEAENLYIKSLYFALSSPYFDAVKLKKDMQSFENADSSKQRNYVFEEKMLDRFSSNLNKIVNDCQKYDKTEITEFVNENKNQLVVSKDALSVHIDAMKKQCEKLRDDVYKKIDDFYKNQYVNKGVVVDFAKANDELILQEKVIKELYSIIDKIKTEYIKKQNAIYE